MDELLNLLNEDYYVNKTEHGFIDVHTDSIEGGLLIFPMLGSYLVIGYDAGYENVDCCVELNTIGKVLDYVDYQLG